MLLIKIILVVVSCSVNARLKRGKKIYLDFCPQGKEIYEVLSYPHLLKIKRTSFARSETRSGGNILRSTS